MFIPGLAQIAGGGHGAAASPVVTHVQHQDTRFDLGYLRLGRVRTCQVMQMPGGSPIFAVHDTGVRYTGGVDELDRENQRPVFHRDAPARSLQQEVPGRIFHLRSDVDRLAPGLAVVFAFDEHQLGGAVGRHTRHGIPPGASVPHAMCPGSNDPDRICLFIHQDRRVSHTVLCVRQAARFAERHRNTHRFPGLSFVGAAAYPYIDHFLQVHTAVVADIVHAQKRPVVGRYQPRNTVGRSPVVTGVADTDSHAADI